MRSTLLCSARGVAVTRPFLLRLITPDRDNAKGHRATYTAQIETYVASQHGSNGISLTRHSTKSSQTFSFGAYEHVILCVAVSVAIATLFRTVKHANVRTSSLITLDDCFD